MPNDHIAMGVNYGRDDFSTYQKSRNANPPPDPSWTDPNRDWTLDNDEKVNNFDVYFDLLNMFKNTGIRFAYNYSDSDNAFVLGGPRTVTLFNTIDANGFRTFEQLPNVTNDWQQFMIDLKYSFNAKVGFAIGYFYEKLEYHRLRDHQPPGHRSAEDRLPGRPDHRIRQPAVQRQHVHRAPALHVLGARHLDRTPGRPLHGGGRPVLRTRRGAPEAGRFGCRAAPNLIRWGRVEIESQ